MLGPPGTGLSDLDKIDAAQCRFCSKTGHIADHTAAEGREHVFAVKNDAQVKKRIKSGCWRGLFSSPAGKFKHFYHMQRQRKKLP